MSPTVPLWRNIFSFHEDVVPEWYVGRKPPDERAQQSSRADNRTSWFRLGWAMFRQDGFRFFFFSREETRRHVHVANADGEAKFWLEPVTSLAEYHGLDRKAIIRLQTLVEEHGHEICAA